MNMNITLVLIITIILESGSGVQIRGRWQTPSSTCCAADGLLSECQCSVLWWYFGGAFCSGGASVDRLSCCAAAAPVICGMARRTSLVPKWADRWLLSAPGLLLTEGAAGCPDPPTTSASSSINSTGEDPGAAPGPAGGGVHTVCTSSTCIVKIVKIETRQYYDPWSHLTKPLGPDVLGGCNQTGSCNTPGEIGSRLAGLTQPGLPSGLAGLISISHRQFQQSPSPSPSQSSPSQHNPACLWLSGLDARPTDRRWVSSLSIPLRLIVLSTVRTTVA